MQETRAFTIEYYLRHPSVKKHCINVLKRYWRISKDADRFDNVNDKLKRILNKTLGEVWQNKYNKL